MVFVQIIDRLASATLRVQLPQGHKATAAYSTPSGQFIYIYKKYQSIRCMVWRRPPNKSSDKGPALICVWMQKASLISSNSSTTLYPTAKWREAACALKKLQKAYSGRLQWLMCAGGLFPNSIGVAAACQANCESLALALGTLLGSLNCKRQQLKKVCVEASYCIYDGWWNLPELPLLQNRTNSRDITWKSLRSKQ